jgi:hypothetical protein
MALRGNKGSKHRYTVEEKLNALKMLDEGLSQVDVEIAKGIPSRTLSRWKTQRAILQAKFDARNGDIKSNNDKPVTNTNSELNQNGNKDSNEAIPDSNDDKPDIKPDTQDTNKNNDTNNNHDSNDHDNNDQLQSEAYNTGYIDGGNDKVEEVASQVEQAYKGYVDPAELKQALTEAKNGLAQVKVADSGGTKTGSGVNRAHKLELEHREISRLSTQAITEFGKTPKMPLPEPPEETIIAGLTKWDLGALASLGGLAGLAYLATKNKDSGKSDDTNW